MTLPIVEDYEITTGLCVGWKSTLRLSCPHCIVQLEKQYQGPRLSDSVDCPKCGGCFLISPKKLLAAIEESRDQHDHEARVEEYLKKMSQKKVKLIWRSVFWVGGIALLILACIALVRETERSRKETEANQRIEEAASKKLADENSKNRQQTEKAASEHFWNELSKTHEQTEKAASEHLMSDYELLTSIPIKRCRQIFRQVVRALDAAEAECKANGLSNSLDQAYERNDFQAADRLEHQKEAIGKKHAMSVCDRNGITYMQLVQINIQGITENWPK